MIVVRNGEEEIKLQERNNSLDEVLAAQISDEEGERPGGEHFSGTFSFNGINANDQNHNVGTLESQDKGEYQLPKRKIIAKASPQKQGKMRITIKNRPGQRTNAQMSPTGMSSDGLTHSPKRGEDSNPFSLNPQFRKDFDRQSFGVNRVFRPIIADHSSQG